MTGEKVNFWSKDFTFFFFNWFLSNIGYCHKHDHRFTILYPVLYNLGICSLHFQASIYVLKVNNINSRKKCVICSKLKAKTPERYHWRRYGVFAFNFKHISYLFLMFPLLTWDMYFFPRFLFPFFFLQQKNTSCINLIHQVSLLPKYVTQSWRQ